MSGLALSLVFLAKCIVLGSHLYLHNRSLSFLIVAECKCFPSYRNNKDSYQLRKSWRWWTSDISSNCFFSSLDTVVKTTYLILNGTEWLWFLYSKNVIGWSILINSFVSFCVFLLKYLSCVFFFTRKRKFNLYRLMENLLSSFVYRYLMTSRKDVTPVSRHARNLMHVSFNKRHELSPHAKFNFNINWFPQILRKLWCPPDSTP